MSKKIIGVTVGTPINPSYLKDKLNPVTSVNGVTADENGNVEITIPDSGGNVSWNDLTDKPFYEETVVVWDYPVLETDANGDAHIIYGSEDFVLHKGETYDVELNGKHYSVVCTTDENDWCILEHEDFFIKDWENNDLDWEVWFSGKSFANTTISLKIARVDFKLDNKYLDMDAIRDEVCGQGSGGNVENGIPPGGKAGQYLRKKSDDDMDVEWADFEIPKEYGLVTYDQDKTITIT